MFDIGFWELSVIGVIALLVIGPERLPGVARTVGLWVGKAKRFVISVKADVDREIKSDELKRFLIEQEQAATEIHEIIEETRSSIDSSMEGNNESLEKIISANLVDDTKADDSGEDPPGKKSKADE
ncbi:MAG: Sec-independent protein translocase protein TatB [Gammaproteobacteria bacterium]|nr:MAG: Sec-independent protein translocase protein TatB [Gammaproteobacteria bacterium]